MKFTHLHVHSHYSLLDGLSQIPDMVKYAKSLGMDSLAITDHGVMYGAVEFYNECKKQGIKPIIGCEVYVAQESRFLKRPNVDTVRHHMILLAKDAEGYRNLSKIVTKGHLEGFYYKPRIDEELLFEHAKGIICLTACIQGKIPQQILTKDLEGARATAKKYLEVFGKDNFYLELQHHASIPGQKVVNDELIKIGQELGIGLVATNDSHYLRKDDDKAQDVLMCISTGTKLSETDRLTMLGDDFSLKSPEQMAQEFSHVPEAISNTQKVADLCNFDFELGKYKLPHFALPDGKSQNDYLKELCDQGLIERGLDKDERAIKQLDYELGVINQTGFASYFLIVADFVNWAKNNGIVVGPGRGSAAGALVTYLMKITDVNPFDYNLLFERFLNPERISMPDIDLDFADERRDEVIRYVEEKYGKNNVAQIITFGTIAARVGIRDVGRVMDYPYSYCDKLAKLVPPFKSLKETLAEVADFKQIYDTDPQAKTLIDMAIRVEGVARHAGTHACGVVVSPVPLDESIPLQFSAQNDNIVVTQFEMTIIEKLGFLKVDFLGLRNLTVIEHTLEQVEAKYDTKIDMSKIPLDDAATFKLLQEGHTTSVFQLESEGMKRYLKQLKPTVMEDIIAMNALYRPGPMQFIPTYIARKHGQEKTTYLHPKLESVLKNTYGLAIYQEQIMQISQVIAGFSLGEADTLRKAIGKKIMDLLMAQREKFIAGALKNNVSQSIAEEIWEWIMPFASYGFNKSHAACYATIAYQTAYLKAHYPAEYMAAVLNSESNDVERISFLIDECKDMGIDVQAPDVNESFKDFAVSSEMKIRFGIGAIKNVGDKVAEGIVEERQKNGAFKSITDFVTRLDIKLLNKKSMESMIKAGVFDSLEERNKLLQNLEKMLEHARAEEKAKQSAQQGLFGGGSYKAKQVSLDDCPPSNKQQNLHWEKELLGLYVSGHILEKYRKIIEKRAVPISKVCKELTNDEPVNFFTAGFEKRIMEGSTVKVAGVIHKMKKIITKNGKAMLFVEVEDLTSKIEVIAFPKILEAKPEVFKDNNIILVSGKADNKDGVPKIIANDVIQLVKPDEIQNA